MYLHTNLQYKLLEIQSKISSILGIFPFTFHPPTKKYILNEKARKHFILTSLVCLSQYIFVIFQLLKLLFSCADENKRLQNLYITLIYIITLTLLCWDLYLFYFKEPEFIQLLNVIKSHTTYIAGRLINIISYKFT